MGKTTEMIGHREKPFCDLDGSHDDEETGLAGCLVFAVIAGSFSAYLIFLILRWMEG